MSLSVVFLTHNYPRDSGDLAGAFLATLAAALVRRGTRVTVVVPSDQGQSGDALGPDGVRVRRVRYAEPEQERLAYGGMADATRSLGGMRALSRMVRALRRAAREEAARGVDVVHAHWWFPAGLAAPPELPLVVTSHGSDAALLSRSRLARLLARSVFRRASVITAVSREVAGWITAAARPQLDVQVQPMPIDVARYAVTRGGAGAVVVGRLVPQKRVHLAVEAAAYWQAQGATMPLTIVGDGPERAGLERLVHARGLDAAVRFLGAVPPDAVPGILATADVMLFPARREGFGLAAAEAFLAGVPVVACRDGGGVLDIVPETGGGRLVEPAAAALAAAALELADLPEHGQLRERWRQRLSAETVAAAAEAWYRTALMDRAR